MVRRPSPLQSLICIAAIGACEAFSFASETCRHHGTRLSAVAGTGDVSRRAFVSSFGVTAAGALATAATDPAHAAATNVEEDKQKLLKGYKRLTYLLDNWEKETTVCGMSDNPYTGDKGCERTPIKVMDYLGYKDMKDPLFKAEKTMRRLEDLVPTSSESDYLEAVEKWMETAEEGSGMAYISSWGEANPGGGKDRVELFIERAKNNVIGARDSLATVIRILDIS